MIYDKIIGKTAVFNWKQYRKSCFESFVLDEEDQIMLLEEVLLKIESMDNESKIYVSTYPIEKKEPGISAYSDMIWIKTKISCEDLEILFSDYRAIEPSAVFCLTDEEKDSVNLYVSDDTNFCDFNQVCDIFKNNEIKIIYWD